jgi:hypothetical protein
MKRKEEEINTQGRKKEGERRKQSENRVSQQEGMYIRHGLNSESSWKYNEILLIYTRLTW